MNEPYSYRRFVVGLDLGQTQDFTAVAVLEETGSLDSDVPEQQYAVRHLERLPLGTPYTTIRNRLVELFDGSSLAGSILAIDQTGVGKPIVDMLRKSGIQAEFKAVTLNAGHAVTFADGGYLVPKKDLVGTLQVLFQARRLKVAPNLEQAKTLVEELRIFQMKAPTVADETKLLWRERRNDDLVLAVGVAAWIAERQRPTVNEGPVVTGLPAWYLGGRFSLL